MAPLPPSPVPVPDKLYAEDGRARTREVKLAVFFAQDKVDDDGYPVRDRNSSSYIATFEPAAMIASLVKAEASAAARIMSASSRFSAMARPGSGTSPAASSPRLS